MDALAVCRQITLTGPLDNTPITYSKPIQGATGLLRSAKGVT